MPQTRLRLAQSLTRRSRIAHAPCNHKHDRRSDERNVNCRENHRMFHVSILPFLLLIGKFRLLKQLESLDLTLSGITPLQPSPRHGQESQRNNVLRTIEQHGIYHRHGVSPFLKQELSN